MRARFAAAVLAVGIGVAVGPALPCLAGGCKARVDKKRADIDAKGNTVASFTVFADKCGKSLCSGTIEYRLYYTTVGGGNYTFYQGKVGWELRPKEERSKDVTHEGHEPYCAHGGCVAQYVEIQEVTCTGD